MVKERVQRRLTTILAADVEGYSRLMRADEETTLETLGEYREVIDALIARHEGRIFSTGGDSVLAEFGSAVEAVRCAISFQEEISSRNAELSDDKKLMFRIGINVGDVMVRDGDLFGDGVNVAARLEGLAKAGGVCISGSVFEQIKHKLSLGFEDMGQQKVKNIVEPVSAYRLVPGDLSVSVGVTGTAKPSGTRHWRMLAVAASVLVVITAGGLAVWRPWVSDVAPASVERMAFPLPQIPSIAVLPFANMSEDPSQNYFVDGMTEDLITDLSKVADLFVVARNSVFAYKGKAVEVRQVAEELGVRYVLEGSVRRAGDQVRINAQLIDATTGGHLWAERYDGSLVDVFALQDKVTRQIVTALALNLTADAGAEQIPKETGSPQAYDAFLRGWEHYRLDTPDHYGKALEYFQQAAELDPNYDRAWAAMASIYWKAYRQEWNPVLAIGAFEARNEAQQLLGKVSGNSPLPLADQLTLRMALWRGRYAEAVEVAERAVAHDPNDADSLAGLAAALIYSGQAQKALGLVDNARRHDPHNESRYAFLEGLAQFGMDQFAEAAVSFERTLELNPDLWNPKGTLGRAYCSPCIALISAYGHLGRTREADVLIERIKRQWVGFNIGSELPFWPFQAGTDSERFGDGLRKAGVVE